jgi:hypothetical protein
MSEMAKQARAAMKAKAKSLATADPHQKVDSSTWTPPEPLNADIKTGMRPISRRAFKSGGKVQGAAAAANMGKSVRSGNKPMTADSMANKDMKSANDDRAGVKHVGALKSGGRAKKFLGGPMMGGAMMNPMANALSRDGGQDSGVPMAPAMTAGPNVSRDAMDFGSGARGSPYKKGGKVAHEDIAADKALIKKMVKPSARTGKLGGGTAGVLGGGLAGILADEMSKDDEKKHGGRAKRKDGGGVFTGPGYPGKVPGVVPGGREAHARGGKARGKSKININIISGKPAGMGDMMGGGMGGPTPPPPGMAGAPAGGRPIPVPPAPGGGAPAPAPMPIPYPVPMGGAGGPPPMPRKAGGRTYRSYKDMDAGAGSGVGRLEKTEIAEHKRGERKAGGRTYRSYKDMDAGAGSGLGRLEKTEIQAHKS